MFEGLFRPTHLLVILVIAMLMFPKKLGELGKGLGEGILGLRQALRGESALPPAQDGAAKDKKA